MVENQDIPEENMYTESGSGGPTKVLTREEAYDIFDRQARRYLNMSGEEFLCAWDAGKFDDDPERPEVVRVWMLIPLVR